MESDLLLFGESTICTLWQLPPAATVICSVFPSIGAAACFIFLRQAPCKWACCQPCQPHKTRVPMTTSDHHPGPCPPSACVHSARLILQTHLIPTLPESHSTQLLWPPSCHSTHQVDFCHRAFALTFPFPGTHPCLP